MVLVFHVLESIFVLFEPYVRFFIFVVRVTEWSPIGK